MTTPPATNQPTPNQDPQQSAAEPGTPPARLLVNEAYDIVQLFGGAGRYLIGGPLGADGVVTQNILQKVIPALRLDLCAALYQAFMKGERTESRLLQVAVDGKPCLVQFQVGPVEDPAFPKELVEVVFAERKDELVIGGAEREHVSTLAESELVARLEEELQRTRDRMQNIEERLRLATEAGGVGIFDHDLIANQTKITELYAHITGFPPDAPPTREAWLALVHPDDRPLVEAIWKESRATGNSYYYECRIVRPDGTLAWLEVNALVTQDETGRSIRLTGAIRDITERKQAEIRQRFLADLGETMMGVQDPDDLLWLVAQRLGEFLGVSRTFFTELDRPQAQMVVHRNYHHPELASIAGIYPLAEFDPHSVAAHEAGHPVVLADIPADAAAATGDPQRYAPAQIRAMVSVPLLRDGRWVATLVVTQHQPRAWTDAEIAFIQTVAERSWLAVENRRLLRETQDLLAQLEAILDNAPIGMALYDRDYRCVRINRALAAINGRSVAEHLDKPLRELTPQQAGQAEALIARILATGTGVYNLEMSNADGRYFWVSWYPVRIDNEVRYVGESVLDITERKKAEEALRQSEQELRVITDNVPGLIGYIDSDQRYRFINAAYSTWHGRPREAILGHTMREVMGDALYKAVQPYIVRTLQGELLRFEQTLPYHDVTRTVWITQVPNVDEQDVVHGFYVLVTDISDRKAVEEALRQSEEIARQRLAELEAIYDTAPIGLCVLDRELRWMRINERLAESNGFSAAAHIGRSVRELLPDLAPTAEPILQTILESEQPQLNVELRGETPAQPGVERIWLEHWFPLHDQDGAVIGINVVAEEVTERKRQERELQELNATLEQRVAERTAALEQANRELVVANRELEQFNSAAAHDLRSPLRGIANLVQWLKEDAAPVLPPPSQKHLSLLQGRVKRLEQMLEDLLAYSRIGRIHYAPEQVDTHQLVHNLIELLAPPTGFTLALPAPLPTLVTLRVPLEMILRNLLSNAIKHHHQPQTGQVQVTVQDQGKWLEFQISDNGPGIAPEYHERIFGMFQTLQPRDQVEGSGIGLALVKKTVESYGGQIWVESTIHDGTTFRFTWPQYHNESG